METKTYTYGDSSWADLLTKYNGKAITYDGIGNMTSYNGASYTWMGRELRKITNGSNTYSYKYNADGIRTSKTVNGTTTEFFLNGSQVLAQKTGDSVMRFFYDSTGKRVGFANGTMLFYYLYNLQGDVIAIVRAATGQIVAKYSYDAWGKCTVTNAAGYAVGDKNPFRYRGYYYDTETGLYYLNSRYYNPEFGRFISADGLIDNRGATSQNLFAYCYNNPINYSDADGHLPKWLSGVLDIASGITQILAGAAMATATAATGVGIAAGICMIANGITTAYSGFAQIYNHRAGVEILHEENWIRTGAKALGKAIAGEKGQKAAEVIYDTADFVSTVCSIGGGVKAIGQTASKVAKTTSLQKYAFAAGKKSKFYNMFSSQRALSPIKEIVTLPKPWFRITNMVGAGIDAVRTTANNIIPLFN